MSSLYNATMRTRSLKASLVLISHNIATLREMHAFFLRAGARITCLSTLDQATQIGPGLDVAVIFAEQMPLGLVAETAADLPVNLVIIVTSKIALLRAALEEKEPRGRLLF